MAKVTITNKQAFLRDIIDETGRLIEKNFIRLSNRILKKIQILVPTWVMASEEISDLRAKEDIWAQLGIPSDVLDQAILDIARLSATTIGVKYVPIKGRRGGAVGKIEIFMFSSALARFLTLPSGKYITEKGIEIPWLKSLLVDGTKILVTDFTYVEGDFSQSDKNRTGKGVMIESPGSYWRIPSKYSGTSNDNFITRSITPNLPILQKLVLEDLKRGFNV